MRKNRDGNVAGTGKPLLRSESSVKAYYGFLARHLLPQVEKAGLSPNQISLVGLLLAILVPPAFALHPLTGLIFLTASIVADSLDGLVARKRNQATVFGAILDNTLDRVADFLYLVGFWVLFWNNRLVLPAALLTLLAVGLTQVVDYISVRTSLEGVQRPTIFMDRTTRLLYLAVWAGLIFLIPAARPAILWTGLALYTILVSAALVRGILHVRRLCSSTEGKKIY